MPKITGNPAEASAAQAVPTPISRIERWTVSFFLLAALLLRCFYIFRFRYDSDEPQHLHTTWGWTQGMLQYRDFFDNHTPLFHILFSPLVAALGERADILTYMRFSMVPLWFVALWAVWHLGSRLYSRRAGLWATVFIVLLPWWFFPALEYRTDNLWAPLWLCALAVLLTGRLTLLRTFAGGFLLGICACTSMKTSLLLAVSAITAVLASQICARRFNSATLVRLLKLALPLLTGLVIVPSVVCAFFAAKGCWADFYYGVIGHNLMIGVDANAHPWYLRLAFPIALPILLYLAAHLPWSANPSLTVRHIFLFLFAGLYYTALDSFWALETRQDYLPFYPVALLALTPLLLRRVETVGKIPKQTALLSLVAVIEITIILVGRSPFYDGTRDEREILREVLSLTRPGEYVMDFKGECVFRRRAFYYVIEPLTYSRMKLKLIEDTVPKDMGEKNVHVVVNRYRWYQPDTRVFLRENYLNIGQVRVAGRFIEENKTTPGNAITFPVGVPARYVLQSDGQAIQGLLDGQPYTGARELARGSHTFLPNGSYHRLTLIWDRAAEAGYSPCANQELQFER